MKNRATMNEAMQSRTGERTRACAGLRRRGSTLFAATGRHDHASVRVRRHPGLPPNEAECMSLAESPRSSDGACESGRTMIEMLVIVSVAAGLTVSGIRSQVQYQANIRDEVVAQQMRDVIKAAGAYILANPAGADSIATSVGQIRISDLQVGNYLPAGFQNSNPYGQSYNVLIRHVGTDGNGMPIDQALVVTTGGAAIPDGRLPQIAARVGSDGGFVASTAPTVAQGAFGGWQIDTSAFAAAPAAGHLASSVFFNDGTVLTDALYRYPVPGTDANTMYTDINMGGKSITGASSVAATGNVSAGSVSASGTVAAASVTASGAVSAATLTASSAVSANTVSATTVSIGGQSVDAGRAALLNQIYGTTCPTGQVLTAQGGTATCVYSVPPGAIAAFTDACPPGWAAFTEGNGHFLVGTGTDGIHTYDPADTGKQGGSAAATLVLSTSNLPLTWGLAPAKLGGTVDVPIQSAPTTTSFDARPPFTIVNWCRKQS
jgi:hypothetical protein